MWSVFSKKQAKEELRDELVLENGCLYKAKNCYFAVNAQFVNSHNNSSMCTNMSHPVVDDDELDRAATSSNFRGGDYDCKLLSFLITTKSSWRFEKFRGGEIAGCPLPWLRAWNPSLRKAWCHTICCGRQQVFPSWGVTRLDGARGKKKVWRPHVRIRSFWSKCTVLKKVLVTLLGLFGAPRGIVPPLWRPCFPELWRNVKASMSRLMTSSQRSMGLPVLRGALYE